MIGWTVFVVLMIAMYTAKTYATYAFFLWVRTINRVLRMYDMKIARLNMDIRRYNQLRAYLAQKASDAEYLKLLDKN